MRAIFMAAFAAVTLMLLPACASFQNAVDTVTSATVSPKVVIVAANAFNAVEATATNYIRYCTPEPQPAGCNDAAIQKIIPAVRSGRDARNGLEQFLTDHPGELGPKGLYDALTAATGTIKSIIAQYDIKS